MTSEIFYGLILAGIDSFVLTLLKFMSIDHIPIIPWMIIPSVIYAIQPGIFKIIIYKQFNRNEFDLGFIE